MMTNLSHSSSENSSQPRSKFPKVLRVLVIDDDLTDLSTVVQLLRQCQYNVTSCPQPKKALDILRERNEEFDIVLCDVFMPDMDGFQLLEKIKSEMNIPVIMMSAEDDNDLVLKLFKYGACYHLTKPVSLEAVKTIWKHLMKRKSNEWNDMDNSMNIEVSNMQQNPLENGEHTSSEKEGNWATLKREREREEVDQLVERDSLCSLKKPRVVWTSELHDKFVVVVKQLGVEKAVPKKILELMNVPGLTRENVASHLQKYRLHFKRSNGIEHQGRSDVVFPTFVGEQFNPINSFNGHGFQPLAASGERSPQALIKFPRKSAQRVVFNPEAQLTIPTMVQQVNINQIELVAAPMFQSPRISNQVGAGAQGLVSFPSSLRTNASFMDGSFMDGSLSDMTNSLFMQMAQRMVPVESNMEQRINYVHIPRPLNPNIQNSIPNESNCHPQVNSSTEPSEGRSMEALDDGAARRYPIRSEVEHEEEDHGSILTPGNRTIQSGLMRPIRSEVEHEEEDHGSILTPGNRTIQSGLMSVFRSQEEAAGQMEPENNFESVSHSELSSIPPMGSIER